MVRGLAHEAMQVTSPVTIMLTLILFSTYSVDWDGPCNTNKQPSFTNKFGGTIHVRALYDPLSDRPLSENRPLRNRPLSENRPLRDRPLSENVLCATALCLKTVSPRPPSVLKSLPFSALAK